MFAVAGRGLRALVSALQQLVCSSSNMALEKNTVSYISGVESRSRTVLEPFLIHFCSFSTRGCESAS